MSKKISYTLDVPQVSYTKVELAISKIRCEIVTIKTIFKKDEYANAKYTFRVEMAKKDESSVCAKFNEMKEDGLVVFFTRQDRWQIRWWPRWLYR